MQNVDAAGLGIGDDHPPRIMGVLNVSEESPYDPSVYDDPGEAAAYVDKELIGEGADIVDVGLESANKRFEVLSAQAELERLDTAIETIESVSGDAVFSIETRYASVAEAALDRGFDMVNDICGFADPEMPEICREYDVAVAKMASPADLERPGAIADIDWETRRSPEWAAGADYVDRLYEALKQNGLTDKTIVDPAFGGWSEAKTIEDDQETFRRLREFRGFGQPMLVSINRKNFLGDVAGRETEERLPVSLAATSMAVERGAHVIRTHDVRETVDAALIGHEFGRTSSRQSSDGVRVDQLDARTPGDIGRHLDRIGATEVDPAALTTRTIEVSGLGTEMMNRIATTAEQTGVQFVSGAESSLLVGSDRALESLVETLSEKTDSHAANSSKTRIERVMRKLQAMLE
ncbi:dihydropteroate synthase [Natranaeroarchaeum aerophilus]|uniref:dihydropteroate synthase n=1 Tax=Natranaeroarchaeum aerophilus TaxID=2917711 RepID=A0AAE3FQP4_9EURY|nr:dihydropteroate synthase [Natranaeroarchaeum aerophilus]MCL9813877.1 dihydropteroate synthase [Natranaeroarchaeum aerophilus]